MNYRRWFDSLSLDNRSEIVNIAGKETENNIIYEQITKVLCNAPRDIPMWVSNRSEYLAKLILRYVNARFCNVTEHTYCIKTNKCTCQRCGQGV